eukprot:9167-Heterococcus_DN1.PRE.5
MQDKSSGSCALLDHGADVQACNEPDECCTALMYAQQKDNFELVQRLLQRGAAVNAVTLGHESALFYSCLYGRVGALKALLAAGADVNGGLQAGDVLPLNGTPLHAAVNANDGKDVATQQQMVKLLLEHGADVDACNCCGQTPLMLAALDGSAEMASMLLAAGASVSTVCTQWRKTALHYATELCKIEALQVLLDNGADATAADVDGVVQLHGACRHGSLEGSAVTVNVQVQQHGNSPLHLALRASQQSAELVSLLIKSCADVNVKTFNKVTPLMLARELPVVRLLLSAGAAVNAKNADGTTALHQAAELELSAAVICCLLKAGADATAVNNHGHEPAAVAAKHGDTATAALLQ